MNYSNKLENEIKHYDTEIDLESMTQRVPNVWYSVEKHFANQMKVKTRFNNLYEFAANHVKDTKSVNILGLGSGICGNELNGIAPLLNNLSIQLTCVDINSHLLEIASEKAKEKGIQFIPIVQDINMISLEKNKYDIIVAYASLHHFLKLKHVASEINKALTPNGIFVTVDIPTRNGYKMWEETYDIVKAIWKALPDKYKIENNTPVKDYLNIDYSINSFECINSEEIIQSLRANLIEIAYVPAFSIMRRFFDNRFGSNYDMRNPLDYSIFEFIKNIDTYYIENKILKPETFFGAYKKRH